MHIGSAEHRRPRHRTVSNVMTVDHNTLQTRSCDQCTCQQNGTLHIATLFDDAHDNLLHPTDLTPTSPTIEEPYRIGHCTRYTPTGWPRGRDATGSASNYPRACAVHGGWVAPLPCMPSAGHNWSAASCEATGGTGRSEGDSPSHGFARQDHSRPADAKAHATRGGRGQGRSHPRPSLW